MISNKPGIQLLVKICEQHSIKHVVFSPGSRNAPLVISFDDNPNFNCLTIPDERVAAFFAMGIAQQQREAVIICCTSGSAALNYAPGIVEAYYQKIPLIVLTADRPIDRIDQGAGQTIRQRNIFTNYVKASYELLEEAQEEIDLVVNAKIIHEAIQLASQIPFGPVHINIPLEEPLYNIIEDSPIKLPAIDDLPRPNLTLSGKVKNEIVQDWNSYNKKLIICGQQQVNKNLNKEISRVGKSESVVVISETTANINSDVINPCIDRLITTIEENEIDNFIPDLLVSIGDAVVSKKIKKLFQQHPPRAHWYVNEQEEAQNTYKCLTKHIRSSALNVLQLLSDTTVNGSNFKSIWTDRNTISRERHLAFLKECEWSDLKAFEVILKSIPTNGDLHISNSSPIRYVQLFDQRQDLSYFCNRGVSGIDGCTSTAMGSAYVTNNMTTLITGDLAFFYDSNAFWHEQLVSNLKVILINNGGGGIFRIIPGPSSTNQYKKFFSTDQHYSAVHIAKAFNCSYFKSNSVESLQKNLSLLYAQKSERPVILEVETLNVKSEQILSDYFDFIKK